MKTENATDIGLIPHPAMAPNELANMKIKLIKTVTIRWPASILANKRTINTNGFVNIPANSTNGINGIGNFIHHGTSGLNISFQ